MTTIDKRHLGRYNASMKKKTFERHEKIQETLEGYRRFDYDYIPFGSHWSVPDETFDYRKTNQRFVCNVVRFVLATVGKALVKVLYGAKVVGKENLQTLKESGALCVCNHFSILDTLFVREAIGHFRSYHTMGAANNKTGVGGAFIRCGGMLPLSNNLTAMRNFNREVERLLNEGKFVNFYAEQAMWTNYQKPRPMKEGAFYYAVKCNVPVVPVFCTFQKSKRGHIRKLRIQVLPPIYADESLPRKARMTALKQAAEAAWQTCYEQAYQTPLTYVPDRRKHKISG